MPLFLVAVMGMATLFDGVNEDGYYKIQLGMSRPEVIMILGRPSLGVLGLEDFPRGGTKASMAIESGGEVWKSATATIWVLFDENGRVQGKMGKLGVPLHR